MYLSVCLLLTLAVVIAARGAGRYKRPSRASFRRGGMAVDDTTLEDLRRRLNDIGYLTPERSKGIWEAFNAFEAAPGSRMITPGVLEILARRK